MILTSLSAIASSNKKKREKKTRYVFVNNADEARE